MRSKVLKMFRISMHVYTVKCNPDESLDQTKHAPCKVPNYTSGINLLKRGSVPSSLYTRLSSGRLFPTIYKHKLPSRRSLNQIKFTTQHVIIFQERICKLPPVSQLKAEVRCTLLNYNLLSRMRKLSGNILAVSIVTFHNQVEIVCFLQLFRCQSEFFNGFSGDNMYLLSRGWEVLLLV